MKKFLTSAAALVFALFIASSNLISEGELVQIYAEKSGTIEYKYSGTTKGTQTLYFKDYGRIKAEYSTLKTTIFGISAEEKKLHLFDNKWSYDIDLKEKTGTKMKNEELERYHNQMAGNIENREELAQKVWESMGGKITGTGKICGKKCDIWETETPKMKVWLWKNIPLKSETSLLGITISIVATKVNIGSVPASKFKVPSGIKISEETIPDDMKDKMPNFFGN